MKGIALLCALCFMATPEPIVEPTEWEVACAGVKTELAYDCEGLYIPWIVETRALSAIPANGIYHKGEVIVLVHPDAPDVFATTVHELVHYIIYNRNPYIGNCSHERIARKIAGQKWTLKDKERYGCL